jgi:DNA-directed RNA polymerase subunit alpha
MKFRDFQLPNKIKWLTEEDNYGKFVCEPFERGYGHTIGNSLRRILLASMEGSVITSVKIEGVQHEYSTIDGIHEDVLEIIFNLKKLRFKLYTEDSQIIYLEAKAAGQLKASDFKLNESIELYNPDTYIATLDNNAKLSVEAIVERGRGYSLASDRMNLVTSIGEIPLDAAFSPVKKVNYDVENARVGQTTDYDKLVLEVWTDGSVSPRESIAYASQILEKTLKVFSIPEIEEIELGEEASKEKDTEEIKNITIEDLNIGSRVTNSLVHAGINTIGQLIEKTEKEILDIDKLGQKSLVDIKNKLSDINEEKGVNLQLKVE